MSKCKECLSEQVCRYNDGINLYCKEDYECPHFKNKADFVEVVYAEWVECSNELNKYCSNCKKVHGDIYCKPPYCPHCGAKMIMKNGVTEGERRDT